MGRDREEKTDVKYVLCSRISKTLEKPEFRICNSFKIVVLFTLFAKVFNWKSIRQNRYFDKRIPTT